MDIKEIFSKYADPDYEPKANLAPAEETNTPVFRFSDGFVLPQVPEKPALDEALRPYAESLRLDQNGHRARNEKTGPSDEAIMASAHHKQRSLLDVTGLTPKEETDRGLYVMNIKCSGVSRGTYIVDGPVVYRRDEQTGAFDPLNGSKDVPYMRARPFIHGYPVILMRDPGDALVASRYLPEKLNIVALPSLDSAYWLPLENEVTYILAAGTVEGRTWTMQLYERVPGSILWYLPFGHDVQEFIRNGGDLLADWERIQTDGPSSYPVGAYEIGHVGNKAKVKAEVFDRIPTDTPVAVLEALEEKEPFVAMAWRGQACSIKYDATTITDWYKGFQGTLVVDSIDMMRKIYRSGFKGDCRCTEFMGRCIDPHRKASFRDLCISYTGFAGREDTKAGGLTKPQAAAWDAIALLELGKKMQQFVPKHAFYQDLGAALPILFTLPDLQADMEKYDAVIDSWRSQEEKKGMVTEWSRDSFPLKYQPLSQPSGRFTTTRPNMLAMPAGLRKAFVAREGHTFVYADMRQCQPRIAAAMSGDGVYAKPFVQGLDMHKTTASGVYGVAMEEVTDEQRKVGKELNSTMLFGGGARAIAEKLGIGLDEARGICEKFSASFEVLEGWSRDLIGSATHFGYVETATLRRVTMSPAKFAYDTTAVNYAVTGTEVEIMVKAVLKVVAAITEAGIEGHIVNFIHDAIMLEVREDQAEQACELLRQAMTAAFNEVLPSTVGQDVVDTHIDRCWGNMN